MAHAVTTTWKGARAGERAALLTIINMIAIIRRYVRRTGVRRNGQSATTVAKPQR